MILVTGGAQGLGASIVSVFAHNGYDVIIGYLNNHDKAVDLCNKVNEKYNVNCIVKQIDVTCEENVKELFDEFYIMKVVGVNLGGTFLVCKYAKNAKYIINISSRDGIDTYNPISLDYSSSKAGIINLTKNLSLYYKDKKVLCVCPGWINTESVINMNPIYLKEEMKRIGQNKLLDKQYVASKIYELVNSEIDSGSVVIIDEKR